MLISTLWVLALWARMIWWSMSPCATTSSVMRVMCYATARCATRIISLTRSLTKLPLTRSATTGSRMLQSVAGISARVLVYIGAHSQRVSAAALLPCGQASV